MRAVGCRGTTAGLGRPSSSTAEGADLPADLATNTDDYLAASARPRLVVILVDSGLLIAAAIVQQNHHRACVDLFTGLGLAGRRLLVPHTVVAETAYMPHSYAGVRAERLHPPGWRKDFVGTEILAVDYARVAEPIERYADDLPLGTTDASVIAVVERLGVREIATLDRRHFTGVTPKLRWGPLHAPARDVSGQRSANSPQDVTPRPTVSDNIQR